MITIDGSQGEGGGQILRTSLALSLVTGQPFRLERIRAGRRKPGLLRQHLTAVEAAQTIGSAEVEGADLGSQKLQFSPGRVAAGDYRFEVGTAGSATLVLQTVLPPLLVASGTTTLILEGGTHNPFAPPCDFLARCFVPLVKKMGPQIELELRRPGFYPAGGGCFEVRIEPVQKMARLDLLERGEIRRRHARAIVANLPLHIAHRELATVRQELGWDDGECVAAAVPNAVGPGNALLLEIECEHVTEVFSGFGERGRTAEQVARGAAASARAWLDANVPVDEHLADQLLLPMALAGAGSFLTTKPSMHTLTNIAVIQQFLPVKFSVDQVADAAWKIAVLGTK